MSKVTVRDLFAGALGLVVVLIIGVLAALEKEIPSVLPVLGALSGGYFFRGAENGGLTHRKDDGP